MFCQQWIVLYLPKSRVFLKPKTAKNTSKIYEMLPVYDILALYFLCFCYVLKYRLFFWIFNRFPYVFTDIVALNNATWKCCTIRSATKLLCVWNHMIADRNVVHFVQAGWIIRSGSVRRARRKDWNDFSKIIENLNKIKRTTGGFNMPKVRSGGDVEICFFMTLRSSEICHNIETTNLGEEAA